MSFQAVQFRPDQNGLLRLSRPLHFRLFLLRYFVGIQRVLTQFGVALNLVDGDAGRIQGHEHGGALHFRREAAKVLAFEHLNNF